MNGSERRAERDMLMIRTVRISVGLAISDGVTPLHVRKMNKAIYRKMRRTMGDLRIEEFLFYPFTVVTSTITTLLEYYWITIDPSTIVFAFSLAE